jgi:hypothetical protein
MARNISYWTRRTLLKSGIAATALAITPDMHERHRGVLPTAVRRTVVLPRPRTYRVNDSCLT